MSLSAASPASTAAGLDSHGERSGSPRADRSGRALGVTRGSAALLQAQGSTGQQQHQLEYVAQLDIKNTTGTAKRIASLTAVPHHPEVYLLASCDSRIRLVSGDTHAQMRKFKGHRNANTRIGASLFPCGCALLSGSEDGWVYVWRSGLHATPHATILDTGGSSTSQAGHLYGSGHGLRAYSATAGTAAPGHVAAEGKDVAAAASTAGKARPTGRQPDAGAGTQGCEAAAGKDRAKVAQYEAFQTPEAVVTQALVVPHTCRWARWDTAKEHN